MSSPTTEDTTTEYFETTLSTTTTPRFTFPPWIISTTPWEEPDHDYCEFCWGGAYVFIILLPLISIAISICCCLLCCRYFCRDFFWSSRPGTRGITTDETAEGQPQVIVMYPVDGTHNPNASGSSHVFYNVAYVEEDLPPKYDDVVLSGHGAPPIVTGGHNPDTTSVYYYGAGNCH